MQLCADVLLFASMNVAGLVTRSLTERAQRHAFMETRRCIEGRVRLEIENQRQVCHFRNVHQSSNITLRFYFNIVRRLTASRIADRYAHSPLSRLVGV